jgi:hypothetical protein
MAASSITALAQADTLVRQDFDSRQITYATLADAYVRQALFEYASVKPGEDPPRPFRRFMLNSLGNELAKAVRDKFIALAGKEKIIDLGYRLHDKPVKFLLTRSQLDFVEINSLVEPLTIPRPHVPID